MKGKGHGEEASERSEGPQVSVCPRDSVKARLGRAKQEGHSFERPWRDVHGCKLCASEGSGTVVGAAVPVRAAGPGVWV